MISRSEVLRWSSAFRPLGSSGPLTVPLCVSSSGKLRPSDCSPLRFILWEAEALWLFPSAFHPLGGSGPRTVPLSISSSGKLWPSDCSPLSSVLWEAQALCSPRCLTIKLPAWASVICYSRKAWPWLSYHIQFLKCPLILWTACSEAPLENLGLIQALCRNGSWLGGPLSGPSDQRDFPG